MSRQALGTQPVFDLGVSSDDHNFLLANGFIASNCFNKSHSTAYGYVTYQTAYLKANYPVEYMAALLTTNSGDQDKVQRYIASCKAMGIRVEPPDVNRSGVDFTPLDDRILFGLGGLRNVGMGPIETLLAAREQDGAFKSLADLCDRVDARTVNRRALESLIYCGAFDTIEPNRQQLINDLDLVIDWAQSRAKDRASGQGNLFDLFNTTAVKEAPASFETAPKAPPTPDFPQQEKLRLEKEILGFYPNHPLEALRQPSRVLAPISLSDLNDYKEGTSVSAIVMLTSVKPVVTKKGDRMAIIQIEDLTGHTEAVIFPKSFERIGQYILADAQLMIWGKVDRRDDQVQFIVDDAEPIESVRMVMVELDPKLASDISERQRLKEILMEHQGDKDKAKVSIIGVVSNHDQRCVVGFGAQFRVQDDQLVVSALARAGFRARIASLTSA